MRRTTISFFFLPETAYIPPPPRPPPQDPTPSRSPESAFPLSFFTDLQGGNSFRSPSLISSTNLQLLDPVNPSIALHTGAHTMSLSLCVHAYLSLLYVRDISSDVCLRDTLAGQFIEEAPCPWVEAAALHPEPQEEDLPSCREEDLPAPEPPRLSRLPQPHLGHPP